MNRSKYAKPAQFVVTTKCLKCGDRRTHYRSNPKKKCNCGGKRLSIDVRPC